MLTSPICCDRYDFLVVAPGLKINFDAVKGLREGLDNPNGPVSSIYSVKSCEKTWKNIQNFKEGRAVSLPDPVASVLASDLVTASISRREWLIPNPLLLQIFTQPAGIIKCAGAPQKVRQEITDAATMQET